MPELEQLIDQARAALEALETEAEELRTAAKLEAIAQIRNIMRAQQLSFKDLL